MSSYQYNPYTFNRSIISSPQSYQRQKYYFRSLSNKRKPKYMNRKVNNTNYNQNRNILFQVPKTEMTLNAIPTSQSINLGMSQINPIISGNNALYNQYRNDTVRSPERKVYSPTQISPNYRSKNIIPTKYITI